MLRASGVLLALVLGAWPRWACADIAPEPGSPEALFRAAEESKSCEPGDRLVECMRRGFINPDSPFLCERLQSDPRYYHLSVIGNYITRLCQSPPDLPKACAEGDAQIACDPYCTLRAEDGCKPEAPSCEPFLHSDKYYRIQKTAPERLYYCGPNPAKTAELRALGLAWEKTAAECRKQSEKSAPKALRCGAGETEVKCSDSWPRNEDSCVHFKDSVAYYRLAKRDSAGSGVGAHVYCRLKPEEAALRESRHQKCLEKALEGRRGAARLKQP